MFDGLAKQHRVYKLEIIGDAYIATCGLSGESDHAERIANFALDMIRGIYIHIHIFIDK